MSQPYITFALGEASVTVGHPNPAEQLRIVAAIRSAMATDPSCNCGREYLEDGICANCVAHEEVCPNCGDGLNPDGGDGVEDETWRCASCDHLYRISIEVRRDWSSVELLGRPCPSCKRHESL
jgi:hypothetical protein